MVIGQKKKKKKRHWPNQIALAIKFVLKEASDISEFETGLLFFSRKMIAKMKMRNNTTKCIVSCISLLSIIDRKFNSQSNKISFDIILLVKFTTKYEGNFDSFLAKIPYYFSKY